MIVSITYLTPSQSNYNTHQFIGTADL